MLPSGMPVAVHARHHAQPARFELLRGGRYGGELRCIVAARHDGLYARVGRIDHIVLLAEIGVGVAPECTGVEFGALVHRGGRRGQIVAEGLRRKRRQRRRRDHDRKRQRKKFTDDGSHDLPPCQKRFINDLVNITQYSRRTAISKDAEIWKMFPVFLFFHSASASSSRTMTAFDTRKPCGVSRQRPPSSFRARPWRAHSSSTASACAVSSLSEERSRPRAVRSASMTRSSSRSRSGGQ